jgi:general stress protein 26
MQGDRIARAKTLLATAHHAAMATVNQDGTPHNTPYFFMCNNDLTRLYWSSHPDSQHSKNIGRTGQLFVVLYDAKIKGGLYIQAKNGHVTEAAELDKALAAHNQARARAGKTPPIKREYYEQGPQKIYAADVEKLWINLVEYDANGGHLRDYRQEITAQDLL